MTFILTRKTIDTSKEDYEYLREALEDVADQINLTLWKLFCDFIDDLTHSDLNKNLYEPLHGDRVSYSVGPNYDSWHPDKGIKIKINFRKEDLEKHPTKYGLDFRNACLKIALRIAKEKLDQNRRYYRKKRKNNDFYSYGQAKTYSH